MQIQSFIPRNVFIKPETNDCCCFCVLYLARLKAGANWLHSFFLLHFTCHPPFPHPTLPQNITAYKVS